MNEPGNKQLVQKMELEHIADRKLPPSKQAFRDIEEDLLFVLDERGHSVHLTDRGVDFMSPADHEAFVLPDLSEAVHRIDHDHELSRRGEDRRAARAGDRVRGEERAAEHRAPAAARARAVREGRELRRAGRRGADRRRVHRPHDAGPSLVGGTAPGGRGQGRRPRQGRDADDGHDHDPELLPHVREAGRHDRYGRDGRDGVLPDLQARGRGHPDEPATSSATTGTISSTRRAARSTTRSSRRRAVCTSSAIRC